MAKKNIIQDFEDEYDDEFAVVDKKAKRKMAKANKAAVVAQQTKEVAVVDDTMSRVALLCQESRWREAVELCRTSLEKAIAEDKEDLQMTLEMALPKLEYSLRRQMAAALVKQSGIMLQKEYHLDVGE